MQVKNFKFCFLYIIGLYSAGTEAAYYDNVDDSNAQILRLTLHNTIKDHTRIPYSTPDAQGRNTWLILEQADENPQLNTHIIDVYLNASYPKPGGRNNNYNREHSWPNSYGYRRVGMIDPANPPYNYPFSDLHHLFLSDQPYNNSRSNAPYRFCDDDCTEFGTVETNGIGGPSSSYPGNSNWMSSGSGSNERWETWMEKRGDVARALFYSDVRYEGGNHSDGSPEPNLILTDDLSEITSGDPYMGLLSVLLYWHEQDPVSAAEIQRNNVIYQAQGNKNPFIDHPEWVYKLYYQSMKISRIVDLGKDVHPAAVNNSEVVAGLLYLAAPTTNRDNERGFRWENGQLTNLGTLSQVQSCNRSNAFGINDQGVIVGNSCQYYSSITLSNGTTLNHVMPIHAVKWDSGGIIDLNASQSADERVFNWNAIDINDNGMSTGFLQRYNNQTPERLIRPPGYWQWWGTAINNNGDIAGWAWTSTGPRNGWIWKGGTQPRRLLEPVDDHNEAFDINDEGVSVGILRIGTTGHPRAVLWNQRVMRDLPLGSNTSLWHTHGTYAVAINKFSQVVGHVRRGNQYVDQRAFFWSERTAPLALNDLLPAGSNWTLITAADINDDGVIVGSGILNGENHGYLLILEEEKISVVNSIGDAPDINPSNDICDTGNVIVRQGNTEPECTLRAAIMQANQQINTDKIIFNIPNVVGIPRIRPATQLPDIQHPVKIDATSQPTSDRVVLDGGNQGSNWSGLVVGGGYSTIKGFVIRGFTGHGLLLQSSFNVVVNNFIGLNANGDAEERNRLCGIHVLTGIKNFIGGWQTDDRNVISGNGQHGICIKGGNGENEILGNYIGTDLTGSVAIKNGQSGIQIVDSPKNVIGRESQSIGQPPGNIISSNEGHGIHLASNANETLILANLIGLSSDGDNALQNNSSSLSGVYVESSKNLIGNGLLGGENVISGNRLYGIELAPNSEDNIVLGNFIGTNKDADQRVPNEESGIRINQSNLNTIGGFNLGDRNIISGNTHHGVVIEGVPSAVVATQARNNTILTNYIGTKANGTEELGNGETGILIQKGATENTIGGRRVITSAGQCTESCNVISGNGSDGIQLSGTDAQYNHIYGNFIGLDKEGQNALANQRDGIHITDGAQFNDIGKNVVQRAQPGTEFGNVISGNGRHAIYIGVDNSPSTNIENITVQSNIIGLNVDGLSLVNNQGDGVHISDQVGFSYIGGDQLAERNIISGNENGVFIGLDDAQDVITDTNFIYGNYIGTNIQGECIDSGGCVWGNQLGVKISGAPNVWIGMRSGARATPSGNLIANNESHGIVFEQGFAAAAVNGAIVYANKIGNDGAARIANKGDGIHITGAKEILIGDGIIADSGNTISGNEGHGIYINGTNSTAKLITIKSNKIGTDETGSFIDVDTDPNNGNELSNTLNGIFIENGVDILIGGLSSSALYVCDNVCNIISGNKANGVEVRGTSSKGNLIQRNFIGVDATGDNELGNYFNGVAIFRGAYITHIAENIISGNGTANNVISGMDGILLDSHSMDTPKTTSIEDNLIGLNKSFINAIPNYGNGITLRFAEMSKIHSNKVSGNKKYGLRVTGSDKTEIFDNLIGRDFNIVTLPSVRLENGGGVRIDGDSTNTEIGGTGVIPGLTTKGNTISGGIFVVGANTRPISILKNKISVKGSWMAGTQVISDPPDDVIGQRILLPIDFEADGPDCKPWSPTLVQDVASPKVLDITSGSVVGTTVPNATVELYRVTDMGTDRARYFARTLETIGIVTANNTGDFSFNHTEPLGTNIALTATVNGTTSELSQLKRPVIFVPGIGGTQLRVAGTNEIVWVPTGTRSGIHEKLAKLALDAQGHEVIPLDAYDVLTHLVGSTAPIIYNKTFSWLNEPAQNYPSESLNQNSINIDVWRFAYDWRLELNGRALELRDFVNDVVVNDQLDRAETCEADILAHSLGGLVGSLYLRRTDTSDIASKKINRFITVATPYLGTPQAVAAQSKGYIFRLEKNPIYGLVFRPRWGKMIMGTRNFPSLYTLFPSENYWLATQDPAYIQDLNSNYMRSHINSYKQLTNLSTNVWQGLSANRDLWDIALRDVHSLTDDWRQWDGPPQIFRIVGNKPSSTIKRWRHHQTNSSNDRILNQVTGLLELGNVTGYRNRQHPPPVDLFGDKTVGDGTVVNSSAKLGNGQGGSTTDFSGAGRKWIADFKEYKCGHLELINNPNSCNSLKEVLKVLQSSYLVR